MNAWAWLALAIVAEVIGTTALKASDGFSKTLPSLITAAGYSAAFWGMSQAMKTLPVGLTYAVWSGVGIVLITGIAWVVFKQRLDLPALLGIALILAGVLVIQLFSRAPATERRRRYGIGRRTRRPSQIQSATPMQPKLARTPTPIRSKAMITSMDEAA